tara:strand:- start:261 stop:938 length:678 start_codon:yes stop_codon:yes gene_type:complete
MYQIKGILFDMDGTVLSSEGLFEKAQKKYLREKKIIVNSEELYVFKGLSYKDFYPQFIEKFNITDDIDLIRKKIRNHLYSLMETDLEYIEGFKSFYKNVIKNSNIKVALVTNTTRESYQKIQTIVNIDKYFNYTITVSEAKKPKPNPDPYLQAMKKLKLKPNNTMIIEDSKTGLLSALKTKSKVVGITTTMKEEEIKSLNENIEIVNSYPKLEKIFKEKFYYISG